MSETNRVRNFELECLRIAVSCSNMAADVTDPALKAHYLQMAKLWPILAKRGIGADIPAGIHFDSLQVAQAQASATRH